LAPLRPARWLALHWPPHGIRWRAVRLGAVQARVWSWAGVAGRSGSWRIGYGHAGMWPPVHRPILCKRLRSYVLDQMPTRKTAARIDLADDESLGAWSSGQHGVTTRIPLGCWARRAQGRESVVVAVNPARARRRRRGFGVGAGALSGQEARDVRARARAWVRMHVGVIDTGLGLARIENGRRGGA
jgi:hypothetical protein